MDRLRQIMRRQEATNRELAAAQRAIVTMGTARLESLEEAVAAIQANTARIDALEAHANNAKLHTGKP